MSAKRNRPILAALGAAAWLALIALPAAAVKPDNNSGPPNKSSVTADQCTECHDSSTLITGKHYQWATSAHATGTAFLRGTSADCAGCHSGGAFQVRAENGLNPVEYGAEFGGDPNPTPQDCRACHQVHETYTSADWALEVGTTGSVSMYGLNYPEGGNPPTFEGGKGNLCASCHQARTDWPGADSGSDQVSGISGHWGPHHGPQSAMLLGLAGTISGFAMGHYLGIEDTCVSCHLGKNANHSYQVTDFTICVGCHGAGFGSDDVKAFQDDVAEQLDGIGQWLYENDYVTEDGHPVVPPGQRETSMPVQVAAAVWNWIYIGHEDKSLGAHNPDYAGVLLADACVNLKDYASDNGLASPTCSTTPIKPATTIAGN